jgi:hypothetical protein
MPEAPLERDLVDAQGGGSLQGPGCLGRLEGAPTQGLDGPGEAPPEQGGR